MRGRFNRRIEGAGRPAVADHRQRPAGAVIGIVTNNTDPDNLGKVKVRFPWLHDEEESHWARIAQPYAGGGRGSFWIPEVGDEVVVVFDRGDPNHPFLLGGVWNGEDVPPPPANPEGEDNHKIFRTRNGHQIIFDDTDGAEKITLIDGVNERHLVIDVAADTITLTADPGDITFEAPEDAVTVACKDLEFEVSNSSTWTVENNLTESSKTRSETITGSDTVSVDTTWSLTAPSTSVSATSSSVAADTFAVSVSGGLTMSNSSGRDVESPTVIRTNAAGETLTSPELTCKGKEVALVSNGPISVTAAQVKLKAGEATLSTPVALSMQAPMVDLKGGALIGVLGNIVKLA